MEEVMESKCHHHGDCNSDVPCSDHSDVIRHAFESMADPTKLYYVCTNHVDEYRHSHLVFELEIMEEL